MAIAVLGGGILGVCTALDLADRGFHVVLFERNAELLTEASLHNEGKLHLGFVYAADRTFRTAERMIRGAATFLDLLERWIPLDALRALPTKPFDYVVHRDTMVSITDVERHFVAVEDALALHLTPAVRCRPVDPARAPWRPLSREELADRYDPALVIAAYETCEIAVDPWMVAAELRRAVRAHPRVELRLSTRVVQAVDRTDGRFDILGHREEESASRVGAFDVVVNALWANRPAIDHRYGLVEPGPWYTRRKLGVSLLLRDVSARVPSATIMLGPFGDIVVYQSGRVYMSWYPDCMIGTTSGLEETDWNAVLDTVDHEVMRDRTLQALGAICPAVRELAAIGNVETVVNGGSIFAHGSSDIDDPASRLHQRIDAGPLSRKRYLSVDTSKYTLAPAVAAATAERVAALLGAGVR
ncbi:MAG: FAD-dependent oxidoreductase [Gemmatimonadota bacterium]